MKTIFLAGGCFWGMQKFLDQFGGVTFTEVGYANGPDTAPTYREVCDNSGHAETVRVEYDEAVLSLPELLRFYFTVIDPTSKNRQGMDAGIQYRTGIYYTDADQLPAIETVCKEVERKVGAPLAVEVMPLENFFPAELYHQKYLDKNPGGYCHIPSRYFHLEEKKESDCSGHEKPSESGRLCLRPPQMHKYRKRKARPHRPAGGPSFCEIVYNIAE